MPGFDGTGPLGAGSMTGRGLGRCGLGMGFRRRFGRGIGRYFGGNQLRTQKNQVQTLKDYKQALKEELEDVEKELKDLVKED